MIMASATDMRRMTIYQIPAERVQLRNTAMVADFRRIKRSINIRRKPAGEP